MLRNRVGNQLRVAPARTRLGAACGDQDRVAENGDRRIRRGGQLVLVDDRAGVAVESDQGPGVEGGDDEVVGDRGRAERQGGDLGVPFDLAGGQAERLYLAGLGTRIVWRLLLCPGGDFGRSEVRTGGGRNGRSAGKKSGGCYGRSLWIQIQISGPAKDGGGSGLRRDQCHGVSSLPPASR